MMPRNARLFLILPLLALAACESATAPTPQTAPPATITLISGDNQVLAVNSVLQPLVIEARDALGRPVANATIRWQVFTLPGAPIVQSQTDVNGRTSITPQLPIHPTTLVVARAYASSTIFDVAGNPVSVPVTPVAFSASAVVGPPATGKLTPSALELVPGGSNDFTWKFFDAFGNELSAGATALSSSSPNVLSVSSDGHVSAAQTGTATLNAERGAAIAHASVKVTTVKFASVIAGPENACGLTAAGDVYCWGMFDGHPHIGPTRVNTDLKFKMLGSTSCGLATDGAVDCWSRVLEPQLTRIAAPQAFVTFAGTAAYGCGLILDHSAYCWGADEFGQIGNGKVSQLPQPVTRVAQGYAYSSIGVGSGFACALTIVDHAVYCWGTNTGGQIGRDDLTGSLEPVRVITNTEMRSISVGHDYACGVTAANGILCWGSNEFRQLGSPGNTSFCTIFVSCSFLPVPVAGGLSFQSVSAGYLHTCAITTTGFAYCWGNNYRGALGNGEVNDAAGRATPTQVQSPVQFSSITLSDAAPNSNAHTCALSPAGVTYCWGVGTSGQTGTTTSSPAPVPVLGQS